MSLGPLAGVLVAGLGGDAGKTLVACGVARALTRRGERVAAFKKGPDYIDAAWLGAAARGTARNLDTFLMPAAAIATALARGARSADFAVIEGNRGLFDGMDTAGSHSSAELAKLVGAPVLLLVDATKVTRTLAAVVLGCRTLDPELEIAGVILNRVANLRQENVIRESIMAATGVPVLGAIPKLGDADLPSRHLGLVTFAEHPRAEAMLERAADIVETHLDLEAIVQAGRGAAPLGARLPVAAAAARPAGAGVRVGVVRDAAFSFYYQDNLDALEAAGAELVFTSALSDVELPACDALVIGGGFPEVFADALAANRAWRQGLSARIAAGLPVWAECGGLMLLARTLSVDGAAHEMVGALPLDVEQTRRPQGHGYVSGRIDQRNPFLDEGAEVRGHEFHYSRVTKHEGAVRTVMALDRGVGIGEGRDGVQVGAVVASYSHIHAASVPGWAPAVVRAAAGSGW